VNFHLLISQEAKLDIFDAFLWYEKKRNSLGFEFELSLERSFEVIVNNPLAFQEKYDNVRIHFVERFPYGIHYIVEETTIRIFGVFHTSINPTHWQKRISKK